MKKQEFNTKVHDVVKAMKDQMQGHQVEDARHWDRKRIFGVFDYAAICEGIMERQLNDNGHDRKTTFMSDLSIGEWCEGMLGVLDTWKRVMMSWKDDVEFMAEFVLCVNWKSWEHHGRSNNEWAMFYSFLYEYTRDLAYEYYEGDDEKTKYMFDYLD